MTLYYVYPLLKYDNWYICCIVHKSKKRLSILCISLYWWYKMLDTIIRKRFIYFFKKNTGGWWRIWFNSFLISFASPASVIPANSVLNFDVLLVDVWNSEDKVEIQTYYKPENCTRTIQVSDFVRYHYNGTFLDGTLFDSRYQ